MPVNQNNPYNNTNEATISESRGFEGLDLYTNRADQNGSMLLQADNVTNNAGSLYVRQGRVGRFGGTGTALTGADSYDLTNFEDGSGNAWLLFTSNGKLYKTQQGTNTYTELLNEDGASYDIDSANVDCCLFNNFAFVVDGVHALITINLSAGYPVYAMVAETVAPTVGLTSSAFDSPTASQWNVGPIPVATITTTTATFTIATGSVTIAVVSSAFFAPNTGLTQNQIVLVTDGTHYSHYRITATGTGTLTCSSFFEPGDSTSGTMGNGASVQLADGGLIGNSYFDQTGGTSGQTTLFGQPWTMPGAYILATNSPDYGPNSLTASGKNIGSVGGVNHPFALLLDNPNDAVNQDFYPVPLVTVSWPSPSVLTKCANYYLTIQGCLQQAGSQASVIATIVASNGSGIMAGGIQAVTLYPKSTSGFNQMSAEFNFSSLGSDPTYYTLYLQSGPKNVVGSGVYLANVSVFPVNPALFLSDASNNQVAWKSAYTGINGTYFVRDYTSSGKNFSDVGTISMPITTSIPNTDLYIRFGFVEVGQTTIEWANDLQFSADGTYAYDDITEVDGAVLANVRYLYMQAVVDLPIDDIESGTTANILTFGPLSAAGELTVNEADYWYYVTERATLDLTHIVESNPGPSSAYLIPTAAETTATVTLSTLTPTNSPTNGYAFYRGGGVWSDIRILAYCAKSYSQNLIKYVYTDIVIETNTLQLSSVLRPFVSGDAGNVLWITGGTGFTVGWYGIASVSGGIATVTGIPTVFGGSSSVGVAASTGGQGTFTDPSNPYYTWDYATGTFTDNTPDGWLDQANLISFSRDPMPDNIQAICASDGRIFAAVGNVVNVSWLYSSDTSAGIMTTLVSNSSDPNIGIAGANFPISADPSDTILRMIPFGTPVEAGNQFGGGVVVLTQRALFLIQGTDSSLTASGWSVKQYDYGSGIGLIAKRGVARLTANEFVFMGPDRLHFFPPNIDTFSRDITRSIQPELYPAYPVQSTLQNQTAFATSWMIYHDSAIYLGSPTPGDGQTTVIWRYDLRVPGWTRWTTANATGAFNITSARSMPPNSNGSAYELYLYGAYGNLYVMEGTTDVEVPGGTAEGITAAVTVHAMRPGFYYRFKLHPLYYRRARIEMVEIELVANATLTVLAQAFTPSGNTYVSTGGSSSFAYILSGGGRGFEHTYAGGAIEGEIIELTLTWTNTTASYLRGCRGNISQTDILR